MKPMRDPVIPDFVKKYQIVDTFAEIEVPPTGSPGPVRIDPLFPANAPARAAGNAVTFEPGARTAWHTHPLGQILIVTAGCGRVQREGGPVEEIRPGDVVCVRAGRKALARRCAHDGHDPCCHPGSTGRKACRLDGEGDRRTISGLNAPDRPSREPASRRRTRTCLMTPRSGRARHRTEGTMKMRSPSKRGWKSQPSAWAAWALVRHGPSRRPTRNDRVASCGG